MFTELWSDESALLTDPNDVHILLHTVNISGYLTTVADDYKNYKKKSIRRLAFATMGIGLCRQGKTKLTSSINIVE